MQKCSVRINDQWRICFVRGDGDAHDVVDDHVTACHAALPFSCCSRSA